MAQHTVLVVSDIHYACSAERARECYETCHISSRVLRTLLRLYRHFIWLRDPTGQNYLLRNFLEAVGTADDVVVANGDFSCDTAFVGVSDDAACRSAGECLAALARQFGNRLETVIGDHELGKLSMFGGVGGLRLSSWMRAREELGLKAFWQRRVGNYRLIGVTSTLLAFPVYEPEALPAERAQWYELREAHLREIREAFGSLGATERVILFCHDPTALPFLWRDEPLRASLAKIERTVIGHLHSPLLFWKSRLLAGMPPITFLGNTARRLSTALHQARLWRPFRVTLCPSLAGLELLKDGGYLRLRLDDEQPGQTIVERYRLQR